MTPVAPLSFRDLLLQTLEAEILLDTVSADAFLETFAEINDSVRLYYLTPGLIEQQIWHPFRVNEPAMNMLMRLIMSFNMRLAEHDLEERFKKSVKAGLTMSNGPSKTGMDDDHTEKLVKVNELGDHPWQWAMFYFIMECRYILGWVARYTPEPPRS